MSETLEIVRKNFNRILSLPSIYLYANSRVLRYIGFVQNEVNGAYIEFVHYFLVKNKLRRFCRGNKNSIIHGISKNLRYDLGIDYDFIPISNTEELTQTNDYMLYSPQNKSDCAPFNNPYDFVENILTEYGYEKDFRSVFYE